MTIRNIPQMFRNVFKTNGSIARLKGGKVVYGASLKKLLLNPTDLMEQRKEAAAYMRLKHPGLFISSYLTKGRHKKLETWATDNRVLACLVAKKGERSLLDTDDDDTRRRVEAAVTQLNKHPDAGVETRFVIAKQAAEKATNQAVILSELRKLGKELLGVAWNDSFERNLTEFVLNAESLDSLLSTGAATYEEAARAWAIIEKNVTEMAPTRTYDIRDRDAYSKSKAKKDAFQQFLNEAAGRGAFDNRLIKSEPRDLKNESSSFRSLVDQATRRTQVRFGHLTLNKTSPQPVQVAQDIDYDELDQEVDHIRSVTLLVTEAEMEQNREAEMRLFRKLDDLREAESLLAELAAKGALSQALERQQFRLLWERSDSTQNDELNALLDGLQQDDKEAENADAESNNDRVKTEDLRVTDLRAAKDDIKSLRHDIIQLLNELEM